MSDHPTIVVGSETQSLEGLTYVTGVQRVVREAHVAMTDALAPRGIRIAPLHSLEAPRHRGHLRNPYLASDPVLSQEPVTPEEVDAYLFLDLHLNASFRRVHMARQIRPRPAIGLVHDVLPILSPQWWPDDPQRVFRIYTQQLLRVCDHVVVTSQKSHDDLLSLGWEVPGELHVIPLGSTFRQRAPEAAPDGRMSLLYVSTVEARKGHDILLEAFDLLRRRGSDVDLTIVGREGWLDTDIAERLRQHPDFGGRLTWLVSPDDLTVSTVARRCSIGVFPSADEGFGLFLEEGLAHGLKMVVSDIPAFRERTMPNVSFTERTPQALADAIEGAHAQEWVPLAPGQVRTMQDFGRELAELVAETVTEPSRQGAESVSESR